MFFGAMKTMNPAEEGEEKEFVEVDSFYEAVS